MLGRTHMLLGGAAGMAMMRVLGYEDGILPTIVAVVGALVPDLDHPKSMINQRLLPIKNKFTKIVVYCGIGAFLLYQHTVYAYTWLILLGLLFIMFGISGHRGLSHSLFGTFFISAAICCAFADTAGKPLVIAFITGLVSHLAGDMLTREGVKLFYPFSKRHIYFPVTITTGGIVEKVLNIVLVIFILERWSGTSS